MFNGFETFMPYFFGLAESSQDVFWIKTLNSHNKEECYINPAYEKVWGKSQESFYENPESWLDAVCDEDKAFVNEWLDKRKSIKDIILSQQEITYRILKPNGCITWIHDSCHLIFDEGKLIGFAGIAKDITQIKLNEQRLLNLAEKAEKANQEKTHYLLSLHNSSDVSINQVLGSSFFMQLAEKSENVFWVRSADYGIQLYLSPAYEHIWQRPRVILYEHPELWETYLHHEDRNLAQSLLTERNPLATPEKKYNQIYRIFRPSGEVRWISDVSFPINDAEGKCIGFAGIAVDITDNRIKEQALREAKERAESANKAKTYFLATMSHELRTPLNGILGVAKILSKEKLSSVQTEYVKDILGAGNHLLSIVNDILDFSKLEAGKVTLHNAPFDFKKIIVEIMAMTTYQAQQKGIKLSLDYKDYLPSCVLGDSKAIRQILINLIGNATKFTQEGVIQITVDHLLLTETSVKFKIIVSDTGIGIPADKLNSVFDRFEQVDSSQTRRYSGTGLGLAITRHLIQLMGGTIFVASELGVGTKFVLTLELPLYTAINQVNENFAIDTVITLFNKSPIPKRILLVEDNLLNQKIAKIMLESLGCIVSVAENAETALANDLLSFDLIFMDIGLPIISGFDITRRIRADNQYQYIPIIAMTAHAFQSDKEACLESGMNDVITKPVMQEELAAMLKKWIPN